MKGGKENIEQKQEAIKRKALFREEARKMLEGAFASTCQHKSCKDPGCKGKTGKPRRRNRPRLPALPEATNLASGGYHEASRLSQKTSGLIHEPKLTNEPTLTNDEPSNSPSKSNNHQSLAPVNRAATSSSIFCCFQQIGEGCDHCDHDHGSNKATRCTSVHARVLKNIGLGFLYVVVVLSHWEQQWIAFTGREHDGISVSMAIAQVVMALVESLTHVIAFNNVITGKEELSCQNMPGKVINLLFLVAGVAANESLFAFNRLSLGNVRTSFSIAAAVFYFSTAVFEANDIFAHSHTSNFALRKPQKYYIVALLAVLGIIASTAELCEKSLPLTPDLPKPILSIILNAEAYKNITALNITSSTPESGSSAVLDVVKNILLLEAICPDGVGCYIFGTLITLLNTAAYLVYSLHLIPEMAENFFSFFADNCSELKSAGSKSPLAAIGVAFLCATIVISAFLSPIRAGEGAVLALLGEDPDPALNVLIMVSAYAASIPLNAFYAMHILLETLELVLSRLKANNPEADDPEGPSVMTSNSSVKIVPSNSRNNQNIGGPTENTRLTGDTSSGFCDIDLTDAGDAEEQKPCCLMM